MLRTILVGLDGSAGDSTTVDLAIRWAKRFDAMVIGLGVVDEPTMREPASTAYASAIPKIVSDNKLVEQARHHVDTILSRFSVRCAEGGVPSRVLEDVCLPSDALRREAERFDLVMVGREANFHFATQVYDDDTLAAVLHGTIRPLVVVPPNLPVGGSVVVAYDGSIPSARTLQLFQSLAICGADRVYVVTVGDDHLVAARCADRAVEFLRSHEIPAEPRIVISSGAPSEAILEEANRIEAGLLVMGAHGRSRIREFLFGSVTQRIIRETTIPVFLAH